MSSSRSGYLSIKFVLFLSKISSQNDFNSDNLPLKFSTAFTPKSNLLPYILSDWDIIFKAIIRGFPSSNLKFIKVK